MSEYNVVDVPQTDTSFDRDYAYQELDETFAGYVMEVQTVTFTHEVFSMQDPLKHAYKFDFEPLEMDIKDRHFVEAHYVEGYYRQDGTYVEGYYRDGDGDTTVNRTTEQGGGYFRSSSD
ncbi:hypothetical protein [Bacillus solitudinis]|uniref:hypothetical protein n=1 Tax=Bacillus solitudinis TaxID=2014074 RepID=UPI000C2305F3|nr:hypothetical protein [Bacillus solitudinis]